MVFDTVTGIFNAWDFRIIDFGFAQYSPGEKKPMPAFMMVCILLYSTVC